MYIKKQVGMFYVLMSLLLCLDAKAFLRLAEWQGAQACAADLLCMATIPREYLYPIHLFLGIILFQYCVPFMLPAYAVRGRCKMNILKIQLWNVLKHSACASLWAALSIGVISMLLVLPDMNWNQYSSLYFLYTHTLRDATYAQVLGNFFLCMFCTYVATGMLFVLSAWLTKKPYQGALLFTAFYFWDVIQPYERSIYYQRLSLSYDSWMHDVPGVSLIGGYVIALTSLVVLLLALAKRKELL